MFNLKIARYIDAYIGTVLCVILSIYDALFGKIIVRALDTERIKNILILNVSEMGSSIPAIPLIQKLKEDYPSANISFITFAQHRTALKDIQFFKDICFYDVCTQDLLRFFLSSFKLIGFLIKNKFDIALNLEIFTCYSAILTYCCGASVRIAFAHRGISGMCQNGVYTHTLQLSSCVHIAENMFALAEMILLPPVQNYYMKKRPDRLPGISYESRTDNEKEEFRKKYLKGTANKYIVIHPGFEDLLPLRCWPYEKYHALIERLQTIADVEIVIVGKALGTRSFVAGERCIDLVNKLSIYELITLFHCADIFLSHDCGLAHIAALTPVHTVCFFGPETPLLYGPLSQNLKIFHSSYFCSPCFSPYNLRTSTCTDNRCVSDISPEDVYQHIISFMGAE
jgi:ADP-heptose:LPS heptosyltransferase